MAFNSGTYGNVTISQNYLDQYSNLSNVSSVGANLQDQLAIVTRDAALQSAGLQAQNILNNANNQANLVDYNAMFSQNNLAYLQTYLRGQQQAAQTQGMNQLGKIRSSIAASGLKLSGTSRDVYQNEQTKATKAVQTVQQEGLGQVNQAQNNLANLRAQSSMLRQSAMVEAEMALRQADVATHRFI